MAEALTPGTKNTQKVHNCVAKEVFMKENLGQIHKASDLTFNWDILQHLNESIY